MFGLVDYKLTNTNLSLAQVKSTSDLLLITSDLYSLQHGKLVMNPNRMFNQTPVVKLGDTFKKIGNFQKRFRTVPIILELDHLTVSGDVWFGRNITLRGTVIIVANEGSRIDLPDGSILENSESPAPSPILVLWGLLMDFAQSSFLATSPSSTTKALRGGTWNCRRGLSGASRRRWCV